MKRLLLSFVLIAGVSAPSLAADTWPDTPYRQMDFLAKQDKENVAEVIQKNGIDPNAPFRAECVKPVEIAMMVWAANGTLDFMDWQQELGLTKFDTDMIVAISSGGGAKHTPVRTVKTIAGWWTTKVRFIDACQGILKIREREQSPQR